MAISLRTAGTWAYDSTGSITVALPTHQAGDMLIVRVAIKSGAIATCDASCATSGWAKVGQFANGTANSGNGTGSVLVAVFWKIAASGAETSPTIDFSQTNTQGGVCAQVYQKGAGETWDTPVGDGGGDTAAGTSHSATIQSHVAVQAGDLVDFFTGICDDTVMTVPTFTQAGVTFAAVVESPAAAGTDTGGADGAYDGGYRIANSGTSSAAAVVTGTLSTSETGTSWTTRLRVNNNQLVTPPTLALVLSTFAPTVVSTQNQRVTPATLSLSIAAFAPTILVSSLGYYRSLTIDQTLVPNTDQTNFPVLVSLTHVNLKTVGNGGHVESSSGFDILFFSDSGLTAQLDHEIELFNPATGQIIMWVRVPSVSHTTDTVFYMKYGDESITVSQEDVAGVWDANYKAVLHLGDGSTLSGNDSTGNNHDGTATNTGATTGIASGGLNINAGNSQVDFGDHADFTFAGGFTIQAWLNPDSIADFALFRKYFGPGDSEFQFLLSTTLQVTAWDANNSAAITRTAPTTALTASAWHLLAATYNGGTTDAALKILIDGVPVDDTNAGSGSFAAIRDQTQSLIVGGVWNSTGKLDEVRLSNTVRSADWLVTEYNNLSDPASFLTLGTESEVSPNVTVTPGTCALSLSTFAPVVLVPRVSIPATLAIATTAFAPRIGQGVSPATVSLLSSTFAPISRVNVKVAPGFRELLITGFAPAIGQGVVPTPRALAVTTFSPILGAAVPVPTLSLSLAGFAPILGALIIPPKANLSLTAFAPDALVGSGVVVEPGTASLSLFMFAPLAVTGIRVTPQTLALSTTNYVPALRSAVIPQAGALTAFGFAPVASVGHKVVPPSVSITLSTFTPRLAAAVIPGTTSCVLSTLAPRLGQAVIPNAAALSLTLFAPTLQMPVVLQPQQASLVLTGYPPQLAGEVTAIPGTAALLLTQFAPTLVRPVVVQTEAPTALTLQGRVPQVNIGVSVTPGPAGLALSLFAPNVVITQNVRVTPASTTLTLSTSAPVLSHILAAAAATPLTVTGHPPVAVSPLVARPGAGVLSLVGFEPIIGAGAHVTVTPGTLALQLTTFAIVSGARVRATRQSAIVLGRSGQQTAVTSTTGEGHADILH